MTCDDAFDRMTSEADLSAETRAHLAACPRCREMHETLSPALDALDSSEADGPSSPWLAGATASSEAVTLARTVAGELTQASVVTRRWQAAMTAIRYTAVLFVGATLGFAVLTPAGTKPADGNVGVPPAACTRTLVQSSTDAQALVKTCMACHVR